MRNRPKPLDHPGAEGGEDNVSVMAFSSSCDGMLNGKQGAGERHVLCFEKVTCLDGNLHRNDFALCNILGDHRTVHGSFTRSFCSEKITSCFPTFPLSSSFFLPSTERGRRYGLTGKMLEAILGNELFTLCTLAYKTPHSQLFPLPLSFPLVFPGEQRTETYLPQVHREQR